MVYGIFGWVIPKNTAICDGKMWFWPDLDICNDKESVSFV